MDTMKNYWRRFAAWVTGSKDEVFQKVYWKLTVCYIVLAMILLCLYSAMLYFSFRKNIRNDWAVEKRNGADVALVDKTASALGRSMFSMDAAVLTIAGVISYVLAGASLKPIKESSEAQKKFSADVSHELRTPLAIMKTDSEVLLRNRYAGREDFRLLAERNLQEIDHMSRIIEDLLAVSRTKENRHVSYSTMDLSEEVAGIICKMRRHALAKGVKIFSRKMEKGFIHGDRLSIRRMTMNIIHNSVSYTFEGGEINVSVIEDDKHMILKIRDTGAGIPQKKLPRVFDRFYRLSSGEGRLGKGAGLGLAIVKEIVEEHKGKVSISSKLGIGTCVTVRLPKYCS